MIDYINLGDTGFSTPNNNPSITYNDGSTQSGSTSANSSSFDSDISAEWYKDIPEFQGAYGQQLINELNSYGFDWTSGLGKSLYNSYLKNHPSWSPNNSSDVSHSSDYWWNVFNGDESEAHINAIAQKYEDWFEKLYNNQMQFNQASADRATQAEIDFAREMWNQSMEASNTSYQRAMDDMRKAGLNPLLGFINGSGGASTPSPLSISGHSTNMSLPNVSNLLDAIMGMVSYNSTSFNTSYKNLFDVLLKGVKIIAGLAGAL